jgi:hypothetical protein
MSAHSSLFIFPSSFFPGYIPWRTFSSTKKEELRMKREEVLRQRRMREFRQAAH